MNPETSQQLKCIETNCLEVLFAKPLSFLRPQSYLFKHYEDNGKIVYSIFGYGFSQEWHINLTKDDLIQFQSRLSKWLNSTEKERESLDYFFCIGAYDGEIADIMRSLGTILSSPSHYENQSPKYVLKAQYLDKEYAAQFINGIEILGAFSYKFQAQFALLLSIFHEYLGWDNVENDYKTTGYFGDEHYYSEKMEWYKVEGFYINGELFHAKDDDYCETPECTFYIERIHND